MSTLGLLWCPAVISRSRRIAQGTPVTLAQADGGPIRTAPLTGTLPPFSQAR